MGGRIDDLILTSYYQTLEADSDPIRLLSPFDSERPYFAEFGWVNAAGQSLDLPNSKTVWQTESNGLTPDTPLVLHHGAEQAAYRGLAHYFQSAKPFWN